MERRAGLPGRNEAPAGRLELSGPGIAGLLKKREGPVSVSASALEPYYYCSAKWLYERVLRLESRRMETSLMAENLTGSLYHAVLDRFFKALAGQILEGPVPGGIAGKGPGAADLPPAYSRLLAAAVREIFDGLPLLGGQPLSALTTRFFRAQEKTVGGQLEILLGTLLAYFGGCRVMGSELNYRVEAEDYCLTGKIDLLLRDEREESKNSGGLIVDIKLSRLPDRKPCVGEGTGGLENFQLPMYVTLAEASGGGPVGTALFFSILKTETAVIFGRIRDSRSGKQKPARQAILRGEEAFEAVMAEFRDKARSYARETGTGLLAAPQAGEERCGPCAYRRVCRTLYTVAGDRIYSHAG
jgi:hypothetical protein